MLSSTLNIMSPGPTGPEEVDFSNVQAKAHQLDLSHACQ